MAESIFLIIGISWIAHTTQIQLRAKSNMRYSCTYCGFHSLTIVRDYTGAPYGLCQRCFRRDPFYRFKVRGRPNEKATADTQQRAALPQDFVGDLKPT